MLMKNKLPSLKKLVLSGGDAFMHPQIVTICEEIRNIFPTIELCAYTNGLLLNKLSDEEIIHLTKHLQLNIISSLYPSVKNLEEYKKQDARFKKLGSSLYYQSSHFYFVK
jgi:MoaA/NifB/PqqE/SkfB family radical SAM enzyme